jgi:Spy/CpxP family protein refolding chaperone
MKKILFSLLLMVFFAVPAFSQMMDRPTNEGHHGHMMGMCNMDRMGNMMDMCLENVDKIGLTDEQINKITPIHREMQKKQARFIADQKIAEIELIEIMDVKDFDLGKANAAAKKIADIKTAHHLEMLKSMKEVRTILTDDQFKKMKKMMHRETSEKKPAKKVMKKQQ